MRPLSLAADADLAASLVRDAGVLARRMREEGIEGTRKTSASDLVTEADHAAEAQIVARLRELRPEDGILGEEGASTDSVSGRSWVIDPVDGTFNFVHGLDWWCSAIALNGPDGVLVGAVHHPHDAVTWVGGPDRPTTRNARPLEAIADKRLSECALTTYLHPPYLDVPEVHGTFRALATRTIALRMNGSGSMDLAAVADGRFDLWSQHSVPPWDWLPGQALVEGAGGATAQVEVHGTVWSVAGRPTAVAEAVDVLEAS